MTAPVPSRVIGMIGGGDHVPAARERSVSKTASSSAGPRPRKGIQSVEIGVRVVDVLAKAAGTLALGDVGKLSGISASQAHRYLTSFGKSGLIYQDSQTGRYGLGSQALRWGISAMSKTDVVEMSSLALTEICERLDLTGILSVWGDRGPTCVRLKRSKLLLGTDLGLGSVFAMLTSATGHVFLSHLPGSMTRDFVRSESAAMRRQGRTADMRSIRMKCQQIRSTGLAQEQSHYGSTISAFAAPIFDYQGHVAAVITLLFRGVPGKAADHQRMAADLVATTSAVSRSLGHHGSSIHAESA